MNYYHCTVLAILNRGRMTEETMMPTHRALFAALTTSTILAALCASPVSASEPTYREYIALPDQQKKRLVERHVKKVGDYWDVTAGTCALLDQ